MFNHGLAVHPRRDRLWHPTCVEAAEWMLKQDMPEIPNSGFDHWDPRTFFKGELLAE